MHYSFDGQTAELLKKEWKNQISGKPYVTTYLFTSAERIVKDFINSKPIALRGVFPNIAIVTTNGNFL